MGVDSSMGSSSVCETGQAGTVSPALTAGGTSSQRVAEHKTQVATRDLVETGRVEGGSCRHRTILG